MKVTQPRRKGEAGSIWGLLLPVSVFGGLYITSRRPELISGDRVKKCTGSINKGGRLCRPPFLSG